jgi:hypothetical protein
MSLLATPDAFCWIFAVSPLYVSPVCSGTNNGIGRIVFFDPVYQRQQDVMRRIIPARLWGACT